MRQRWIFAASIVLALAYVWLRGGFVGVLDAQGSATASAVASGKDKATFAAGCFWCVEADFDKVPGVVSTTSGYIGGHVANPTYPQVSGKKTGHAEAVEIVYDPARVSYEQLLAKFWRSIDPTTVDRQFCDAGSPYRSAIFTHDAAQLAAARASLRELEANKPFKEPVVPQIVPATTFYPAEAYHQDFARRNPAHPYIVHHDAPKVANLKRMFPALLKKG
jgi:peptide-methionine (S)-S-oxide reductase